MTEKAKVTAKATKVTSKAVKKKILFNNDWDTPEWDKELMRKRKQRSESSSKVENTSQSGSSSSPSRNDNSTAISGTVKIGKSRDYSPREWNEILQEIDLGEYSQEVAESSSTVNPPIEYSQEVAESSITVNPPIEDSQEVSESSSTVSSFIENNQEGSGSSSVGNPSSRRSNTPDASIGPQSERASHGWSTPQPRPPRQVRRGASYGRCRYWPRCTNVNCKYAHPTVGCE